MKYWRLTLSVALLAALLLAVGAFGGVLAPAELWAGVTNFDSITLDNDLLAGDDVSSGDDLSAGDDLTVTDDAAIGGDVTVTGNDNIGLWSVWSAVPIVTVTQGGIITPTGSNQSLTAAGSVSTGSIATMPAGYLLVLRNTSSNAITISDTGTLTLSGNIALGQNDTLVLWSDGAGWVQLSTTNN